MNRLRRKHVFQDIFISLTMNGMKIPFGIGQYRHLEMKLAKGAM